MWRADGGVQSKILKPPWFSLERLVVVLFVLIGWSGVFLVYKPYLSLH